MQLALDHQEAIDLRVAITGAVNDHWLYVGFLQGMREYCMNQSDRDTLESHIVQLGMVDLKDKILLARHLGCFHPQGPGHPRLAWSAAARLYMGIVNLDKHASG